MGMVPIYVGHPDVPGMEERWPDKMPVGTIADLEVRDNGLYARPAFSNEGMDLVESRKYRAFSARWFAAPVGEENGAKVYRPDELKIAGLTNHPNLPVELFNEWTAGAATGPAGNPAVEAGHTEDTMKREHIIALLTKHGIAFANDATDEQLLAALDARIVSLANETTTAATRATELGNQLTARDQTIVNLTRERDAARGEFGNERQAHIDSRIELALREGRIALAQRDEWKGKLAADFANTVTALAALKPELKTDSATGDLTGRNADMANSGDPKAAFANCVAKHRKAGMSGERAVRAAIAEAPQAYAEWRKAGGQAQF